MKEPLKETQEEIEKLRARNNELDGNNRLLLEKIKQLKKELKSKDEIIKEKDRRIAELRYKQQKLF